MARQTLDQMPQAILVNELRVAIDRARNTDESSTQWEISVGRIMQLCRENPRSTLRAHVLHNLGCSRRRWLRQLATTIPSGAPSLHLEQMSLCRDRQGVAS